MKMPPRWLLEIWKRSNRGEILAFTPEHVKGLEKLLKLVGKDCGTKYPEWIVGYAWALYIDKGETEIINEDTKFALASFLKAGSGHLARAYQDFGPKLRWVLTEDKQSLKLAGEGARGALLWVIQTFDIGYAMARFAGVI
jgi:hypothetical protein